MDVSRVRMKALLIPAVLTGFALSGCVDEKVIFRDRELVDPDAPVEAAGGYIGYSDATEKFTVCGNCHVGMQAQWENTAHADAWAGLQGSGAAQAFCEGCHTVNQLGNPDTTASGYLAVEDERYHDVQCESCHGAGLNHIQNPDASQPLAGVAVGEDLDNLTTGCGECHTGTHHPFVEEWALSAHASPSQYAAGREGCNTCHEGKAVLAAWGVNANYLEKGSSDLLPLTCAVCHDPHDATNQSQLRFPVNTVSIEEHICARCHNRRVEPDPTSSHGLHPHAPEAPLLVGDAGWFPPNLDIERGQILGSHGSEANPTLCAGCHVQAVTVTDTAGGEFHSVGHSFAAIPCLDAEGLPTTEDCAMSTDARLFDACATSGCHSSEDVAFSALFTATNRIMALADDLRSLLLQVDANGEDPGGAIDATDGVFTVAEGAFFNLALAEHGGFNNADPNMQYAAAAAHNPFLIESLLSASITAVENEYGVTADQ